MIAFCYAVCIIIMNNLVIEGSTERRRDTRRKGESGREVMMAWVALCLAVAVKAESQTGQKRRPILPRWGAAGPRWTATIPALCHESRPVALHPCS